MNVFPMAAILLAAATENSDKPTTSLWQIIVSGGPAMYVLGALSIIAVMLVFGYLFTMRRGAVVTGRYMQTADVLLRKNDFLSLLAVSNRHNEAVASVMERTLHFLTKTQVPRSPRRVKSPKPRASDSQGCGINV